MTFLPGLFGAPPEAATDWSSFRGPGQDGISTETGIQKEWPRGGLPVVWRIQLGSGFSTFAAVGDRLYTLAERAGRQEALCLDAATGRVNWTRDLEEAFQERQGGDGPRATPAVKDGVVYVQAARGTLAALDLDGKPLWQVNTLKKFGAKNIGWGLSASPLLEGDLVIVPVGAAEAPVAAFHRKTGEVAWRSGSDGQGDRAGYSTPYAIIHEGRRQVIVFQGRALLSLDPESGKRLWSYPWKTMYDVNAAAPIYEGGLIFISSGYNHGCALLRLPAAGGERPEEVWTSRVLRNKFSSSVLRNGFLYGFDENRLKCVEFRTGKEKWQRSGLGHGTLLLADGHLIVLGDQGDLALVEATPDGYREKARMEGALKGGIAWTSPVLHRGVLYVRNLREAAALRLKDS